MRFVFITILVIFFLGLVIKDSNEASKGMSFWDFIVNFTHISSLNRGIDQKSDEFLKDLKDKKENLDYLQQQINSLRTGLKEMPDAHSNEYFRNLLSKFENEEYLLNQQVAQLNHVFEDKLRNQSQKDAEETARLIQQNQRNFKEQQEVMRNLMESNQMRAEAQMERLNDLMEQHQMFLEALIDRTSALMEERQNHMQNSARPY